MKTFSALLAFCAGNSPVTSEFPAQRPVTRRFDVFNKQLNRQWGRRWFETPSRSLWRHCNGHAINRYSDYMFFFKFLWLWNHFETSFGYRIMFSWSDHITRNNVWDLTKFPPLRELLLRLNGTGSHVKLKHSVILVPGNKIKPGYVSLALLYK